MSVFSQIFSLLWEFAFPIFWELHGLMPHMKYVRKLQLWNVCVFPYVSLTTRLQFSYVFGIVRVSITHKTEECGVCKKPRSQEHLCFPIIFPYKGNSLFPYFVFWELYEFLLLAKIIRNTSPRNVLFSHSFPILSKITFPIFWEQYY